MEKINIIERYVRTEPHKLPQNLQILWVLDNLRQWVERKLQQRLRKTDHQFKGARNSTHFNKATQIEIVFSAMVRETREITVLN